MELLVIISRRYIQIPYKVLERIVHNRLAPTPSDNELYFSPRQFRFRLGSSTQEALLVAKHDWQRYLDFGLSSAVLFLDMSKAFDKLPHCHLLQFLSAAGVSGPLLKWFKSYLTNRTQKSVLNGFSPTSLPARSGVPRVPILGPLLFIIYTNFLADLHFSPGSSVFLYTDDILLYSPLPIVMIQLSSRKLSILHVSPTGLSPQDSPLIHPKVHS